MAKHPVYVRLIHSRRWLALRRQVLTARPLCERCLSDGVYRSAREVHHLRPVETGRGEQEMARLCFDPLNLQSLCSECHRLAHIELRSNGREARLARRQAEAEAAIASLYGALPQGQEPDAGGGVF